MSDLIDDDSPPGNAPEFSVSEISGVVRRLIEGEFPHIRVRGEVGRVSRPRSGHVYLDLKDDRAVLAAVIWKGVAQRLRTQPEEGIEVVATGRLTTFAGQSRYQMVIESLAPAGVGALMAMLEKRRRALAAEGLFDAARKKPLPFLPRVIGVITSPSGAVIRDILHRLRDRFPRPVLIWPVAVQGEACAPEVARAIRGFNALPEDGPIPRPDLLIVARGGGSVEDLWGFNDEAVVRAAAESRIPLISAVGHETDTTLIDHAADRRAPTPTAAAEMAVPVRAELMTRLAGLDERRLRALARGLEQRRQRLRDLARALPRPADLVAAQAQRLDTLALRLDGALRALLRGRRLRYVQAAAGLRPATLAAGLARFRGRLEGLGGRLGHLAARGLQAHEHRLAQAAGRLSPRLPAARIAAERQRLQAVAARLSTVARTRQAERRARLAALDRLRQTLGYRQTLARGFVVMRDGAGNVITRAKQAAASPRLEAEFADGRVPLRPAGGRRGGAKGSGEPPDQGSLF